MKKKAVLDSVKEIPQNFELDELFERLIVIEKIEKGRSDVKNKNTVSHKLAKDHLSKWIK